MSSINFNNLPGDIKLIIFNINKQKEKKEYIYNKSLFNQCFHELTFLKHISNEYKSYIKDYIGFSLWEHNEDYNDWIKFKYKNISYKNKKYIEKKKPFIKYMIHPCRAGKQVLTKDW